MQRSVRAVFATVAIWFMAAGFAVAADFQNFSDQSFAAAQASGRPIVVEAYANWCPTCRAQAPTLAAAAHDPQFDRMIVFRLDYDHQLDARRRLGIRTQSTLIAFAGRAETGRSVGDTNVESIAALLRTAMR